METLTSGLDLPAPKSDATNRPFWEAARERRFVMPRCAACGLLMAPPVANCSACLGDRFDWVAASGRGTVFSFIEYHRAWIPEFANHLPYIVAIVELQEGPRLITGLVGETGETLAVGTPVEVAFQERAGGSLVPVFQRAARARP